MKAGSQGLQIFLRRFSNLWRRRILRTILHFLFSRTRICYTDSCQPTETRPCQGHACGYWANWGPWGYCSATCGSGIQGTCTALYAVNQEIYKFPEWTNQKLTFQADRSPEFFTKKLFMLFLTVMENSVQRRTRRCKQHTNSPLSQPLCPGDSSEKRPCRAELEYCPADGGWSQWSDFEVRSSCSGLSEPKVPVWVPRGRQIQLFVPYRLRCG